MLTDMQREELRDRTQQLLWDVGMKIESEAITAAMLARGCQQTPSGRVRIPAALIEEMAARQRKTQQADDEDQKLHHTCGIDWAHHIIWNGKQREIREAQKSKLLMSAFDCGPTTYYDYAQQRSVPVNTEIFTTMLKLAEAMPEIGYTSTWYRQDAPQAIERIESLVTGLRITSKLDGIEAIDPPVIKYLKEISEIITERPGDSSYLAGSECITSPLILERRSAEDIVARRDCGVHRYHVASMPTIGVATPATIAGTIIMEAAETLGGMVACYALDPESDLSGRAISLVADMRNGNSTSSGPEPTLANLGVRELFDAFWGGHLWVEIYFSPFAKRPGLQAVSENYYGLWRTANLLGDPGIPYPGMGTLNSGGTGSPEQLILDMEIRRSQRAMQLPIAMDEEHVAFQEICEHVHSGKDFLNSDHTLRHCRELWTSPVFLTAGPKGWTGDEKSMLDRCSAQWQDRLKKYEPPVWPAEKLKALDGVLARAKREFGVA